VAARKALSIFRALGSRIREAATLLDLARGYLGTQDSAAHDAAREAMAVARSAGSWSQVGLATQAVVEAQLQAGNPQAALTEAEEQLSLLRQGSPDKSRQQGIASAMSAVVVATSALRGVDEGLKAAKRFVEKLREEGNTRGEVCMLHKLATMSPFPDYALNTAQVALVMAQKAGLPHEEKALKKTLTDLYVAQGKIDKAPNRREALLLLQDLGRELEKKDGEKFDDASKNLDGYWNALTQNDIDATMQKIISRDPPAYLAFLKAHGANAEVPGEKKATEMQGAGLQGKIGQLKTGPLEHLYFGFRASGIAYGPRYRCNVLPTAVGGEVMGTVGVLQLQDISDDWERELQYNPSILDCALQAGAATSYYSTNP